MPALTRRHLLAGTVTTAAVAAMPAVAIAALETAGPLSGGRSLLSGSFAPGGMPAIDGDFYADIATGDMWHRASGAWKRIFDCARSEMERVDALV